MSIAEANLKLPANFAGIVKIFPLPNLVLFPGVIQPLHIFEPRYRALMRDALNSDQLIAMATLKPGWESESTETPDIYPTVCVGKIVTHAELEDGRFNLLLCGARRAEIIREIPAELPYRMADVKLSTADSLTVDDDISGSMREHVLHLFEQLLNLDSSLDQEAFEGLASGQMPLGLLLDLLTFSSGASVGEQQKVLATTDVIARGNRLIRLLESRVAEQQAPVHGRFPPEFSFN